MKSVNMKKIKGFTLVELMIVVVIIGILAAVAVPEYVKYVIKGNRAAAQAFMMDVAARQKQYLLDARTYADSLNTLGMVEPSDVSKNYTITIVAPTGGLPTFIIKAAPKPDTRQAEDGEITLNDAGVKAPPGKW